MLLHHPAERPDGELKAAPEASKKRKNVVQHHRGSEGLGQAAGFLPEVYL